MITAIALSWFFHSSLEGYPLLQFAAVLLTMSVSCSIFGREVMMQLHVVLVDILVSARCCA